MGWAVCRANSRGADLHMKFVETALQGVYLIEPERIEDRRGFFARSFCQDEFAKQGLVSSFVQCNISFNHNKGTLRGMHYQAKPHPETKLVRCTQGAIYDVILDLRPDSATYTHWIEVELSAQNQTLLYIPTGLAHGFQTLTDNAEVFYQMAEFYHPECAQGVRWDDEAFQIEWPLEPVNLSQKDQSFLSFTPKDGRPKQDDQ